MSSSAPGSAGLRTLWAAGDASYTSRMMSLGARLRAVPTPYFVAYVVLMDLTLAAGIFPLERYALQTAFFDAQNTPLVFALLCANLGVLVLLLGAMAATGIALRRGLNRLRRAA